MKKIESKLDSLKNALTAFLTSRSYRQALIYTGIFSVLANAFAYFNLSPQHDSANHMFEFAGTWELSLGRFLLPLFANIQGHITTPWLVGVSSIFFISLMVWLVCDLLNLEKPWQVALAAGILSANLCVAELLCVFTWTLPVYMLSALFSGLGVYCLRRGRSFLRYPGAVLLFVTSLGLYQAEITFGIGLLAILAIQDLMDCPKTGRVILYYVKAALVLLASALSYYLIYHLVLRISGIPAADSYNSLSNLGGLSPAELAASVKKIYTAFFQAVFGIGSAAPTLTQNCGAALGVITLLLTALHLFRKKTALRNILLILAILLVLPALICLMDIFMAKTRLSYYLLYAFNLVHIFLLFLLAHCGETLKPGSRKILTGIGALCLCLILAQNIQFSNQIYSYQKIMYDRTVSVATRILDRVESDPEYESGETEVVMIGALRNNAHLLKTLRIDDTLDKNLQNSLSVRYLMKSYPFNGGKVLSVTYNQTFDSFAYLLGSEINYVSDAAVNKLYSDMEQVQNMPAYPKAGYCQMIDGRMVIKLS